MSEYKTIRVSKEEYALLDQVRNNLVHNGINSLDKDFRSENDLNVESFALGALVGLGALAVLYLMGVNGG